MKSSNFFSLVLLLLLSELANGQFSPPKDPFLASEPIHEPYLFPINPGRQNWLAGTMGELRSTHFHAGIDIRTDNLTGVPVRSTQRGYISRVIVGTYGYGQAVFVTHPDGNVSVYGHLDRFNGKLASFVLNKHYEIKSFDLDLEFAPNQFPVNRGDTIAFSGNTGGSSGPHLHFEIRDNQNEALNPLSFKFDEIKDVLPPIAQKIAFKTLSINSRLDDQFGRREFFLLKNGTDYYLPQPVRASGKIGLEILAFDRLDFSRFRCGINEIEVLADSQKVFSQKIDKINFDDSHGIVSLMDFETLKTRGLRFNKLYVDDGNPLKYYENSKNKGEIFISDKPVNVQIRLIDTYGNKSDVHFKIMPVNKMETLQATALAKPFEYSVSGNILELKSACSSKEPMTVFEKGNGKPVNPSYQHNGRQTYLIDLQKIIPDSAQTCHGMFRFDLKDKIPSGTDYTFYSDWANIRFAPNSLYDTLFIHLSKSNKNGKDIYSIGKITDPLNSPIEILLKAPETKPDPKVAIYHLEGRVNNYLGGEWQNGNLKFKTTQLGDFIILKDTVSPMIHRIHCYSASVRFRIMDNLSGISQFEATINGQWLLMTYDYKTGILQSERLDKMKPLQGDFELKVIDRSGNQSVYRQKLL